MELEKAIHPISPGTWIVFILMIDTDSGRFLIDTSAWLAFILSNDRDHKKIDSLIGSLRKQGIVLYTTNDVVDETITRLIYDSNLNVAKKFISLLVQGAKEKTVIQFWTDEKIQQDAFEILAKFDDQKLSLTDATTVAIMQRFNLDAVLTLDSDFKKIGVKSLP